MSFEATAALPARPSEIRTALTFGRSSLPRHATSRAVSRVFSALHGATVGAARPGSRDPRPFHRM